MNGGLLGRVVAALAASSLVSNLDYAVAQPPAIWGPDTSGANLVAAARLGSERYRDRGTAIADGFRRVGPDFPGMGEHWVHTGRLVAGILDPRAPTILSYVSVRGQPVLVGVGYALPLREGEPMPRFPAGDWHEHGGTIDDASFLPVHGGGNTPTGRIHLAVLHAWVWSENPHGVFATENTRLPFLRAGVAMPAEVPVEAARAVALGFGGEAYYQAAVARASREDSLGSADAETLLAAAAERARQLVSTSGEGRFPILELVSLWNDVWEQIVVTVGASARNAGTLGFAPPAHHQ